MTFYLRKRAKSMSNLLLDGFMLVLLFMAIVFCWRLNKRLQNMRQMGAQMAPFMKSFSGYVNQISQDIETLRQTAEVSHKDLGEKIPQALSLKDDFDILLEHSEKIAARLDQIIEKAQLTEQHLQQTVQTATKGYASRMADRKEFDARLADQDLMESRRIEPELSLKNQDSVPQEKTIFKRPFFEEHLPRIQRPYVGLSRIEEPEEEKSTGTLMNALKGIR